MPSAAQNKASAPSSDAASEHVGLADALRLIAILVVVYNHLARPLGITSAYWIFGDAGVTIFFVLSGFLLGRPFVDAILCKRDFPNVSLFAQRRFLRIFPAYAVVVAVSGIATWQQVGLAATAPDFLTHVAMIHNFFPQFIGGLSNGPLWTMGVDADFYVALPMVAWMLLTIAKNRPNFSRERLLVAALTAVTAASLVFRVYAAQYLPATSWLLIDVFGRNLLGMGFTFCAGVAIALVASLGLRIGRFTGIMMSCGALALYAAIAFASQSEAIPRSAQADLAVDVASTVAVTLLIIGATTLNPGWLRSWVSSRFVTGGAAIAYCLYLTHQLTIQWIEFALAYEHLAPQTGFYGIALVCECTVIGLAVAGVLHRFVEQPFLDRKDRLRESGETARNLVHQKAGQAPALAENFP